MCYTADLASGSSQLDLVQRLMRDLPYLDILVQNAAMHVSGPIDRAGLRISTGTIEPTCARPMP